MGKSVRRTPIVGWCVDNHGAQAAYKTSVRRAFRRLANVRLICDAELPPERAFGNPYFSPIDGKGWRHGLRPKLMRK